jgi:uncharacterized protein (DUF2062 family)
MTLGKLYGPMVIAMIAVRMVQPSVYQVIDVISMRYGFVPTTRAVLMRALRLRGTVHGVSRAYGQGVFVYMIAMRMVEVPVMQIIDMPLMTNRRVPAFWTMLVSMIRMVLLGTGVHRVSSFCSAACGGRMA